MESIRKRPAGEIDVAQFRLLFQWPLILCPDGGSDGLHKARADVLEQLRREAPNNPWQEVDASKYPPRVDEAFDAGTYGEFVYFHDFAQDFLYPKLGDPKASFALFCREDIGTLEADFAFYDSQFSLAFDVARLTLHMFDLGVAILSLELVHRPGEVPLTLDKCQTAIDHLRRTYVPFWKGGKADRVPSAVKLNGRESMKTPPSYKSAAKCLARDGFARNPTVFPHWTEMIAPLKLIGEDGGQWRDPSDERMPVNSFISLTPAHHEQDDNGQPRPFVEKAAMDRRAVLEVQERDWYRLWDAEQAGTDYPYNPEFLQQFEDAAFYDRFAPDERSGELAGRHLFGEHHYSFVGSGWYTDNILLHHWRRHYAQLALVARFQVTMLLALSGRITRSLGMREENDRSAFDAEIEKIHDDYLTYRHRYHFTGVTSQIQGGEMYDRWISTLKIDALVTDVQDELQTAIGALQTNEQIRLARGANRLADAANRLGIIAGLGVVGGLIVGALGSNLFVTDSGERAFEGWPEMYQLAFLVAITFAFLTTGYAIFKWSDRRAEGRLLVIGCFAWIAAIGLYVFSP